MKRALDRSLQEETLALEASGLRRSVERTPDRQSAFDFTSNDYLGLATHPAVLAASTAAIEEHGCGARASRLLGGGSPWEESAEARLASWLNAESALLFPTGYQANLGLVTSLAESGDALLSDAKVHASMIDACRLSKAQKHIFQHNNLEELERLLVATAGARRRFVLVEAIYSMDGDSAPIDALNDLCVRHDAWLLVDEAHSIGVCGEHGEGLACPSDARPLERVYARVVTGGKALGCAGGFVVGSSDLRNLLIHRARSFIFTTGIAPALAAGLDAAIQIAQAADAERAQLRSSLATLASALGRAVPLGPIMPFVVGANATALELASELQAQGFGVRAVRPPTVPQGSARLRLVLHAHNSDEAVQRLAQTLSATAVDSGEALEATRPRPFAIVGTDTDIGKTIVSAVVARVLAQTTPVTYWKPVQTGDDSDTNTVRRLTAGTQVSFDSPVYEFPLPASPHEAAAAASAEIDFASLVSAYESRANSDVTDELLIELAGGLLVPYDDRHTQADWLLRTKPRILLVARSGLGTLNHTMLTVEALRARNLEPEALILVGPAHTSNCETLRERCRIANVIEVPMFDPLTPESLQAWIDTNPLDLRGTSTR